MLKLLDPPYVYNVFKDDLVGFVEAIEDAIANPIERSVAMFAFSSGYVAYTPAQICIRPHAHVLCNNTPSNHLGD